MAGKGRGYVDRDQFSKLMAKTLEVSLTPGELTLLMEFVDRDGDGKVTRDDFRSFLEETRDLYVDTLWDDGKAITDIAVSTTEAEALALQQRGFRKINVNCNSKSRGTVFLWYAKGDPDDKKYDYDLNLFLQDRVTEVTVLRKKTSEQLSALGYQVIPTSLNKGSWNSMYERYIWYKKDRYGSSACWLVGSPLSFNLNLNPSRLLSSPLVTPRHLI